MSMAQIKLIARAVIRRGDDILLAQKLGDPNTFLPGGHIEYGEYSDEALLRELKEELGVDAVIGALIGTFEYQFNDWAGKHHHEINFIYTAETADQLHSMESHLEFQWCQMDKLAEKMLLPDTLPELLTGYINTGNRFHSTK